MRAMHSPRRLRPRVKAASRTKHTHSTSLLCQQMVSGPIAAIGCHAGQVHASVLQTFLHRRHCKHKQLLAGQACTRFSLQCHKNTLRAARNVSVAGGATSNTEPRTAHHMRTTTRSDERGLQRGKKNHHQQNRHQTVLHFPDRLPLSPGQRSPHDMAQNSQR